MIEWLEREAGKLVVAAAIEAWLQSQPASPWWDALREAAAEYASEMGGAELPKGHFREWLVDWGRELRRRQTGLLLLTAHRAKGLEFDHVAVLDGGWERTGRDEDADASRRLYYVAMTRARQTLTLARLGERHVFLDSLATEPCCQRRELVQLPPPASELGRMHRSLELKEVDLGYSGRKSGDDRVHRAIRALATGDPISLRPREEKWELVDTAGTCVAKLARGFSPPKGMAFVSGRVQAIVVRRREDSTDPKFAESIRCDRWEVVVPELVFECSNAAGRSASGVEAAADDAGAA